MQFCYLISAVLTESGFYIEIPLAVLIQRSLLTELIFERRDKFGFQNGGVSSPDLWETEAKIFQRDCVFFLCFVHFWMLSASVVFLSNGILGCIFSF